jgi:hypothetical protein
MTQASVEGKIRKGDLLAEGLLPFGGLLIKQELRQVKTPQSLMRGDAPYVVSSDESEGEEEVPQQEDSGVAVDEEDNMSVCGRLDELAVKGELVSEEERDSDTSTLGDADAAASPSADEEAALLAEGDEQSTDMEPVVLSPAQLKAANPEGGQQAWGDKLFPYVKREAEPTIAVIQAWMDLDYMCPAGGCDHIPVGCRGPGGEVLSPQRWDHFMEHWDTVHNCTWPSHWSTGVWRWGVSIH